MTTTAGARTRQGAVCAGLPVLLVLLAACGAGRVAGSGANSGRAETSSSPVAVPTESVAAPNTAAPTTAAPTTTNSSTSSTTMVTEPAAAAASTTSTSTTVPVDPAGYLSVVELGGYRSDSLGWVGAVGVANTSTDPVTVRSVTMRWLDATGQVVDTSTELDRFFLPGETTYFAARMWRVDAAPVRVEMAVDGAMSRPHIGRLTVVDAALAETLQGSVDVTGTLTSSLEGDMTFVDVVLAFFDAEGSLLWAESILVPEVPAGASVPFSGRIGIPAAAPEWASFRAQAQP